MYIEKTPNLNMSYKLQNEINNLMRLYFKDI